MDRVAPEKIRNIAVVGHGGCGKTTLVESLLHAIGATTRLGKVDDGTSILDTDPEEHKRRITINVAIAAFVHDGTKFNLLDTPGFADIAESEKERVGKYRQQLVEAIVETNEDLLTRYLDGKEMSYEELRAALHAAVREGKVIQVVATSASKNVGYTALLNTIREMLPSPAEDSSIIGKSPTGAETARKTDPAEKFSAFVFKTLADPFVGKLSYVRVYSGTLHHNSQVYDATKGETERVGQIFFLRGKEQDITDAVGAGDICAIPKLTATSTNATLCDKDAVILYDPIAFPPPSFSVAIDPASKADLDKLATALHKLTDEDP